MEFQVQVRELKELLRRTKEANKVIMQEARYSNDNKKIQVKLKHLLKGELDILIEVVTDRIKSTPSDRHNKWLLNRINEYLDLREQPVGDTTKVAKLEHLPIAIVKYLETVAPHRWVFQESDDKMFLPWIVTDITYTKRRRDRDGSVYPAFVTVSLSAYSQGNVKADSERITEYQFEPTTVAKIFQQMGFRVESSAAVKRYEAELETYAKYQDACGDQLYAIGEAYASSQDRWGGSRYSTEPMVRNGFPTKVVVDPNSPEIGGEKENKSRAVEVSFWNESPNLDTNGVSIQLTAEEDEDGDELDEEEKAHNVQIALPLHPYLGCFDLEKHSWIRIHSGNLQEYPWDKELIHKLIIPQEQSDLLKILISKTGEQAEDIIRGKMAGVIVIATGQPGTGKTLTAEVFSEFIQKPLYNVQCSQLGLDIDSIEKNLTVVLGRASRWGAVMLIDEADVYIRRRGEDITQNAIVGVFLRLLEYYRGVLFMTSNMGSIIDDAIISRATAWIQYGLPGEVELKKIWKVLAAQYKVTLTEADVKALWSQVGQVSGRSVRNLLKLAVMLEGTKASVKTINRVAQYQALESRKEAN